MLDNHHYSARPVRRFCGLLLALGLLASAWLPVAANAESVYEVEQPTIPSEPKPTPHKPTNPGSPESSGHGQDPKAGISKEPDGGSVDSEGGSGQDESSGGSPVGGDSGEGPGQGNPGGGSQEGAQPGAQTGSGHTPVTASKSTDGGSSSPLVPILIALAVLAAISVGVVLVRQRRQGDDPGGSVSPTKAS